MPLPTTLGHLLGDASILGTVNKVEEEEKKTIESDTKQTVVARNVTFMEHIENLGLPKQQVAEANKNKGGGNRNRQAIRLPPQL